MFNVFLLFLLGGALSKSSSKTADTVLLSPIRRTTSITSYIFSEPVSVKKIVPESCKMTNGDGKKSSQHFSFSQPVEVLGSGRVTSNHLPDLTSSMVSGPVKARVNKEAPALKFGSVMDILGGKSDREKQQKMLSKLKSLITNIGGVRITVFKKLYFY
jgi:hypothetical protein